MKIFTLPILAAAAAMIAGCTTSPTRGDLPDETVSSGSTLYRLEVNAPNPEGKDLIMVLQEIEHHERYSIVRVDHQSGASVPSIMTLIRGFWEMANEREVDYFINLKEWIGDEDEWMYVIGFSDDPEVDPATYFGIESIKEEATFDSVEAYGLLFGQGRTNRER